VDAGHLWEMSMLHEFAVHLWFPSPHTITDGHCSYLHPLLLASLLE
jgi:hypothetical protein